MTNLRTYIFILGTIYFSNAYYFSRDETNFSNISRNKRQTFNGSCKIPNNPPYGKYGIIGDETNTYKEGDSVSKLVLYLKCEGTYRPSPPEIYGSFCVNGVWEPPPVVCSRTCSSIRNTETTEVQCSFNNVGLRSCENPVDGTVAKFTCEPFYEELSLENTPYRFCRNGAWDGIPHCYPICGQKHPVGRTNVINGTNVKLGDYPWHVGVYNARKEYRCGGAIISQRIILSAAHCFTDLSTGEVRPKENYLISVGKYYHNYHDFRDEHSQYSTIDSINIPSRYKGSRLQYQADIAVVILTKQLILTEAVQPVCVDWGNKFENQQLMPNSHGVVTGWGYTMEGLNLSDELKELSIPYVTFDQCYNNVPRAFQTFVRPDKICGGYLNISTSVCEGDSGGGLVFLKRSSERYFIRGIVSTSPATIERQCDSNQYGIFTLVSAYLDFINNVRNAPMPYLASSIESSLSINTNIYFSRIPPGTATSTNSPSLKCEVPHLPLNVGFWVQSNDEYSFPYEAGDFVNPFNRLIISCNGPHILNTLSNFSVCVDGIWKPKPSRCQDLPNLNLLPTKEVCGISKSTDNNATRFLTQTTLGEFPWLVRIETSYKHAGCGGVLINNRYVLTSAFCVSFSDFTMVSLGEYNSATEPNCVDDGNRTTCAPTPIKIPIQEKIMHENGYRETDIGLIRMERAVDFTDYIKPICLPTSGNLRNKNFENTNMIVAGWAKDIEIKSQLKVPVISNEQCETTFKNRIKVNLTQICALVINNLDFCKDSSGNSLMKFEHDGDRSNWYAFGVLSYGLDCISGIENVANVYTRITTHVPWILSKLQP